MVRWFKRPNWQLAIISGLLVGLSYPPLHLGFIIWFGLIPLFHCILMEKPRKAARLAFISSITANFISLYWIGLNSGAGFLPVFASLLGAVIYLGIFWALFGYVVSFVENKSAKGLIILPFAWVAMEIIRSLGPLGFPWINLGLTQTEYLPLLQISDITGSYGISFWIVLINIGIYLSIKLDNKVQYMIGTSFVFVLMYGYGLVKLNTIDESKVETTSIAITQPNINPDEKWDPESKEENFALMHSLLDSALKLNPDLVLWPESAVPAFLRLSTHRRIPIVDKLAQFGIPLFTGTVDRIIDDDRNKIYYNSSIFIDADGNTKMYQKIHLVPFAEYIPLSGIFPSLEKLNFGQGNFTKGTDYTIFELDSIKFSNVICYESSIPQVVRRFVKNGAQFITIQANDGWLGTSSGPYQHFELAKLRSIENRIPIVRCANTGISGYIHPSGVVGEKIPLDKKAIVMVIISPSPKLTFYTKFGDIFAILCLIYSSMVMVLIWVKRIK